MRAGPARLTGWAATQEIARVMRAAFIARSVGGEIIRPDLHGDIIAKTGVLGAINLAPSALDQLIHDPAM